MVEPLWLWDELTAASGGQADCGGLADGAPQTAMSGFSIDTRSLVPGDVFVALVDSRDGHDFVTAAFERGAAAALVRSDYQRRPGDGALIRVEETLRGLERIGVAARGRLAPSARVIAVTGSAGKTGTKEMLRACLKACASSPGKVHAPEKSFNNHWGVPLTLARMPADAEFAVFEIGMNHAGEIRPLTRMVRPHVAIVTNVLPVHVGNFEDGIAGVAGAKAEIFEGLEPGGTAIILRDGPHFELLSQAARNAGATVSTFGLQGDCDVKLAALSGALGDLQDHQHVVADFKSDGQRVGLDLAMAGQHLAVNALSVLAAIDTLGCDRRRAAAALAGVQSAAGRGARQRLGGDGASILLLDESYNANPASMRAALANLVAVDPDGRSIAVLGDMLELGAGSVGYHTGLADAVGGADLAFCCGEGMRHLFDILPPEKRGGWAATSAELMPAVLAAIRPGDAVMVKGSLGSRMAPIVEAIKKRFAGAEKQG